MNVHVYMYNTEGDSHKHGDILSWNVKVTVQPINGPLLYTVHVTQYWKHNCRSAPVLMLPQNSNMGDCIYVYGM